MKSKMRKKTTIHSINDLLEQPLQNLLEDKIMHD